MGNLTKHCFIPVQFVVRLHEFTYFNQVSKGLTEPTKEHVSFMSWLKYYSDQSSTICHFNNSDKCSTKVTHWSLTSECIMCIKKYLPAWNPEGCIRKYLFWAHISMIHMKSTLGIQSGVPTIFHHMDICFCPILKMQIGPFPPIGFHEETHTWDLSEHIHLPKLHALPISFPLPLQSYQSPQKSSCSVT